MAILAATAVLGGCGVASAAPGLGPAVAARPVGAADAPPATAAAARRAGPAYAVIGDLCAYIDFNRLRTRLPVVEDLRSMRDEGGVLDAYTCRGVAGPSDDVERLGSFTVRVEIHDNPAAVGAVFADARDAAARMGGHGFVEVPLGQAGYTYTDPVLGNVIAACDGNLVIEVTFTPFADAPVPAAVISTLVLVAYSTMDRLLVGG